ncbi:Glycosyltransferase involved in cell wall bisynthesis [Noviherbaspirillum humi]|uniref:Glycosyltransferase involved in cell wall bisynthesis n=1 Tax=Noviherbaspirillum humi TaxID=1688639 RepID=A0A239D7I9_9BURK|nr:glycosyltransferase family 4 protein [Noviherbaspirillum humi]SNS27543.1 Glycosyltransferase involved in cell wall bisynthesis [Noviherbaspirillum humi]
MTRIAIVTNVPPPYRIPVFQRIGEMPEITFQAIFCSRREPNRLWDLPPLRFDHVFLRERFSTVDGRYIHNNPDVLAALRRFRPDVVITDGFNPTHLYAFGYAWLQGLPHVAMTDGTDVSEQGLSRIHKLVRRFIYARTRAFVPASAGGERHYASYGVPAAQCFRSCLCIDNAAFDPGAAPEAKRYDLMFSGRIEEVKNPGFALDVAIAAARRLGRKVSLLFAGAGSMEAGLKQKAERHADSVEVAFHGFATQSELPSLYRSARLFLFPTRWDPWGVVANEACAAGLPVLVSPQAGVVGELVRDGENGRVLPLEVDAWSEAASQLLTDDALRMRYAANSLRLVRDFTFDTAAQGLVEACRFALVSQAPMNIRMPA